MWIDLHWPTQSSYVMDCFNALCAGAFQTSLQIIKTESSVFSHLLINQVIFTKLQAMVLKKQHVQLTWIQVNGIFCQKDSLYADNERTVCFTLLLASDSNTWGIKDSYLPILTAEKQRKKNDLFHHHSTWNISPLLLLWLLPKTTIQAVICKYV